MRIFAIIIFISSWVVLDLIMPETSISEKFGISIGLVVLTVMITEQIYVKRGRSI